MRYRIEAYIHDRLDSVIEFEAESLTTALRRVGIKDTVEYTVVKDGYLIIRGNK